MIFSSNLPRCRKKEKFFLKNLMLHGYLIPIGFTGSANTHCRSYKHPYVPETYFLKDVKQIPADLENYVLKPLFSFAGQGVSLMSPRTDIEKIKDPENWILQRKVKYADVIETPDIPAKAEIRIFYFWKDGEARPVPTNNLARLSKGKMIGVRYNKDKEWVGGSFCWFEK